MHNVGREVVEQPLIVRDQQHAQIRTIVAHLLDTLRDDPQRIDVEPRVGLVEDGKLGFEDGHLQNLVALLFAAAEALVEVAVSKGWVHFETCHPVADRQSKFEDRQVEALAS